MVDKGNRFKFRAWSPSKSVMVLPDDPFFWIEMSGNGDWNVLAWADKKIGSSMVGAGNDWILMQSTGLTDKNGVEVFEGDIVEGPYDLVNFPDSPRTVGEVMWLEEKWYIWASDLGRDFREFRDGMRLNIWQSVEVIGNIHEHPELLTEK